MDFSRPDNARKINKLKVLNALRRGSLSRAELSRELIINKVSISEITDSLMKDGLIESGEKDMSTSGRPSTKLSIKKNGGRVFSFVFSQSTVTAAASNLIGQVLRFERFPKDENMINQIASFINKMTADNPIVYGVTIVSENKDEVPSSAFPWPVTYSSHVISQAKAEEEYTKREKCLYVSWSDNIEAAYKNEILFSIPTFGHMKVTNGITCSCGGNGCLNVVASGLALKSSTGINQYRKLTTEEKGLLAIDDATKALSFALAEAVQALGAESIVITGELSAMPSDLYASLSDKLKMTLPPTRESVTIYRAERGDKGVLEGAGIIALDKFFYSSEILEKLKAIESSPSFLL